MTQFSALKTRLQQRVNDADGNTITTGIAGQFLNEILEDWAVTVEPLWRPYGWYVTAKQFRYDLPSDWIKPKTVHWYQNGNHELTYVSPKAFQLGGYFNWNQTSSRPSVYTVMDGDLWVGPPPGTSGNTSTISDSGGISASDATIGVADGTQFHANGGMIKIEDEQIMHQNISSNNLTLCLRGQGGTTAATHPDSTAVSRLDLIANYLYVPATLSGTTDSPAIEQRWHHVLLEGAIGKALNMLGREDEAQIHWALYETKKLEAKREQRRIQRDGYLAVDSPYP